MSRNGETKAETEYRIIYERIRQGIEAKLQNRMRALAPCPYSGEEVYAAFHTPAQHEAMALLMESLGEALLRVTENFRLQWDVTRIAFNGSPVRYLEIPFIDGTRPQNMMEVNRYGMSLLPHDMRMGLLQWAASVTQLYDEGAAVLKKLGQLHTNTSTGGQMFRIWPELLMFFPPGAKDKVIARKAASPLHLTGLLDLNKQLIEPWQREALVPFNEILASALMLETLEDGGRKVPQLINENGRRTSRW